MRKYHFRVIQPNYYIMIPTLLIALHLMKYGTLLNAILISLVLIGSLLSSQFGKIYIDPDTGECKE